MDIINEGRIWPSLHINNLICHHHLTKKIELLSLNDILSYIDFAAYLDYFMDPKLVYCSISMPAIPTLYASHNRPNLHKKHKQ